jgi:hypothetical protein
MKRQDLLKEKIMKPVPEWATKQYPNIEIPVQINKLNIQGDSSDYHVLWNAAQKIKGVDGLILEIGVRLGMGTFTIMNSCLTNDDKHRRYFGVDCYGDIRKQYSNKLKIHAKYNLMAFAAMNEQDFTLLEMEDFEFFNRFADGIPIYERKIWETNQYTPEDYEWKDIVNKYALVHIDGPHRMQDVIDESEFFLPRIPVGGVVIYDDIDKYKKKYNHDEYEPTILEQGFEMIEKCGSKVSYVRVKEHD